MPELRWAVHADVPSRGAVPGPDLLRSQDLVLKSAKLIVDTLGRYLEPAPNVVKA